MVRPSSMSAKVSGGPKDSAHLRERRYQHEKHNADGAGDERRSPRCRAAPPFLHRHLVAVEAGHHRGGFARRIDQHRGDRAAVHRAGVERGEHDDPGGGIHAEGERQQHRHARGRPTPGNAPIRMPIITPAIAIMMLNGVSATPNPIARFPRKSR